MQAASEEHDHDVGAMGRFYIRIARPLLQGPRRSKVFLIVGRARHGRGLRAVRDQGRARSSCCRSTTSREVQVVLDLPQGSSLEETDRTLMAAADRLKDLPELTSIQAYAGTAAPFNFNGLVRHYYLRDEPQLGDLSVNLKPKGERSPRQPRHRARHPQTARRVCRCPPHGSIKVVEVPPGPPVLSTLLAEVYGPDAASRRELGCQSAQGFRAPSISSSMSTTASACRPSACASRSTRRRSNFTASRSRLSTTRSPRSSAERKVGYSQRGSGLKPIAINVALPRSGLDARRAHAVDAAAGRRHGAPGRQCRTRRRRHAEARDILLSDLSPQRPLRRDGDGRTGGPLRGADLWHARGRRQDRSAWTGACRGKPTIAYHGQPLDESKPTLLWDGEWEVTYVTFRDMGAAFGVAILGIYLLVVAQFGSFVLPLVILMPVPLTLIGIVLGHWAARRALHRDLDDRLHRARRHHRAQLDPARRFHPHAARAGHRRCARR